MFSVAFWTKIALCCSFFFLVIHVSLVSKVSVPRRFLSRWEWGKPTCFSRRNIPLITHFLLVLIGVGNATVDVSICGVTIAKQGFHLGEIEKISEVQLSHLKNCIIQLYDLVEYLKVPNG